MPGGVLLTTTPTGVNTTSTWSLSNIHGDITATLTGTTLTTGLLYDPHGQPLNPTTATTDPASTPSTRGNPNTLTDAWAGTHQRAYEHTAGLNQTHMGARTYLPTYACFTSTVRFPPKRGGIDNEDCDVREENEVRPGVP